VTMASSLPTGIRKRHSTTCPAREGGACRCDQGFEAFVYSPRDRRKIRETFATVTEAKRWRVGALKAVQDRKLRAPSRTTLREAAEAWLDAIERGEILCRSRRAYKPSVCRTYRGDFDRYILPDLGARRLADIDRADVQALIDTLVGSELSGSKVRNIVVALQAFYRRACRPGGEVMANPTVALELPAPAASRERAASPEEAAELVDALPEAERALWATAFYAGLRRGELRALRWLDVVDDVTVLHVRRGWDDVEGPIEPKSQKGTRRVPIPSELRSLLLRHKLATGRSGEELVFGRSAGEPFTPTHVHAKARKAWAAENEKRIEKAEERGAKPELLDPIGLHEARHTYVSLMHDAGLSLERIGDYVGHSSKYMTDRYRHLLDGHEAEAARTLDDYLTRKTGARTGAKAGSLSVQAVPS
jgi:integrase